MFGFSNVRLCKYSDTLAGTYDIENRIAMQGAEQLGGLVHLHTTERRAVDYFDTFAFAHFPCIWGGRGGGVRIVYCSRLKTRRCGHIVM